MSSHFYIGAELLVYHTHFSLCLQRQRRPRRWRLAASTVTQQRKRMIVSLIMCGICINIVNVNNKIKKYPFKQIAHSFVFEMVLQSSTSCVCVDMNNLEIVCLACERKESKRQAIEFHCDYESYPNSWLMITLFHEKKSTWHMIIVVS